MKERIEQLLSEILSDKYDCKVTLRFEPRDNIIHKEQQYEKAS